MQVAEAPEPVTSPRAEAKKRKAFWTKQFYLWHWVSSAICLAAMLLFAVTGVYTSLIAALIASIARRFVKVAHGAVSVLFLIALVSWPLIASSA